MRHEPLRVGEGKAPVQTATRRLQWREPLVEGCTTWEVEPDDGRPPRVMTTVAEVQRLLASDEAPTVFVGYEFSGGLTMALVARGRRVLTSDIRYPEHDNFHYWGDLHDVFSLKHWEEAYFVGPPCSMILRGDLDCLPFKLKDGRSFYGALEVWWCVSRPNADAIFVEQPDTIAHDHIDWRRLPGVKVVETRTGKWGDEPDKEMRLTMRNLTLEEAPHPPRRAHHIVAQTVAIPVSQPRR